VLSPTFIFILCCAIVLGATTIWALIVRPSLRARQRRDESASYLYEKPTTPPQGRMATLSNRDLLLVLMGPLGLFLYLLGPVWRQDHVAFDAGRAIFWSYLVIPPLTLAALALRDRLSVRSFMVDAGLLVVAKFVVTATIIVGSFSIFGSGAPSPASAIPRAEAAPLRSAPVATPIEDEHKVAIRGRVVASDGSTGVEGALVWISEGLEDYAFEAPSTPVSLTNDGTGLKPTLSTLMTWQPLSLRASDGRTHTIEGYRLDVDAHKPGPVLNLPIVSGHAGTHRLTTAAGLVRLRCVVHSASEAPAWLLLLHHPFAAKTGPEGQFAFAGVPNTEWDIRAWHPQRGELRVHLGQ
jgi:hypothetical protein